MELGHEACRIEVHGGKCLRTTNAVASGGPQPRGAFGNGLTSPRGAFSESMPVVTGPSHYGFRHGGPGTWQINIVHGYNGSALRLKKTSKQLQVGGSAMLGTHAFAAIGGGTSPQLQGAGAGCINGMQAPVQLRTPTMVNPGGGVGTTRTPNAGTTTTGIAPAGTVQKFSWTGNGVQLRMVALAQGGFQGSACACTESAPALSRATATRAANNAVVERVIRFICTPRCMNG